MSKNLSQLVELSTALDAGDWTFVWDASAGTSKKVSRANFLQGDIATAGTITASGFVGDASRLSIATPTAAGVMSAADKAKLDGIAAGAGVSVNADWNSGSGGSRILNKPALGTAAAMNVGNSSGTVAAGDDDRLTNARTPTAHAASHVSGGIDPIKLDDLDPPDDTNDLNATTSRHGLLPKLGGGTSDFLRADGTWSVPPGAASSKCISGPFISSHDDERGKVGDWSFNPDLNGGTYWTKVSVDPSRWVGWQVS
jgi:hypothetical protein